MIHLSFWGSSAKWNHWTIRNRFVAHLVSLKIWNRQHKLEIPSWGVAQCLFQLTTPAINYRQGPSVEEFIFPFSDVYFTFKLFSVRQDFILKTSCLSTVSMVMSGYSSRLWPRDSQPQFWTKFQVWEWLQQVMDMHQIDASSIPFQNFDIDGHQLCSLSHQDFIRAAGSAGHILYHSITELKWGGAYESLRGAGKWSKVRLLVPMKSWVWFKKVFCWSVSMKGSESWSGVSLQGGNRL